MPLSAWAAALWKTPTALGCAGESANAWHYLGCTYVLTHHVQPLQPSLPAATYQLQRGPICCLLCAACTHGELYLASAGAEGSWEAAQNHASGSANALYNLHVVSTLDADHNLARHIETEGNA